MSLADRLTAADAIVRKGPTCGVAVILARLDEADAAALSSALDDRGFSNRVIAEALSLEGHGIGSHVVSRHRRGECACVRYSA